MNWLGIHFLAKMTIDKKILGDSLSFSVCYFSRNLFPTIKVDKNEKGIFVIKNIKEYDFTPLPAGDGGSMSVLIGDDKAPNFMMRKFILKSGGFMPLHTNSVEHEQYVLSGSAKVVIGDEVKIVNKDDILFIPAGVAHSYDVVGDESYEFLCLVPNREDVIKIL